MASKHYNREAHGQNDEELRIVMVGKTGIGKSATGNTILGHDCFYSKFSAKSVTDECSKDTTTVDGQKVAVIDTPGLFDTRCDQDKMDRDISQCISYSSPGPHVFLVVVQLGRFTEEEKMTVQKIQEMFGQAADRYSMVLFTHGDLLGDTTIEEFMKESKGLNELLARCNGLYHVFNNKLKDRSQVTELLQKIGDLVKKNGGSHFTSEMFQEAERTIEEEKQRILKEKEEQIRKEKEELEKEIRAELEEKLRCVTEELQAELEEEKGNQEMDMTWHWKREEGIKERKEREKEWKKREGEINKEREEREKQWKKREDEINKEERHKRKEEEREEERRKREEVTKREREQREDRRKEEEIRYEKRERESRKRENRRNKEIKEEQLKKEYAGQFEAKIKEMDKEHQQKARHEAESKISAILTGMRKAFSSVASKLKQITGNK